MTAPQVTHLPCPAHEYGDTHHLVTAASGTTRCTYCHLTPGEILAATD